MTITEAELDRMHDGITDRDTKIIALVAALRMFGRHRRVDDAIWCARLNKGMAFTNDCECTCGLFAAIEAATR